MEKNQKCVSSSHAWSLESAECSLSSSYARCLDSAECGGATPLNFSPTSRVMLLLQSVGLLQHPKLAASWRPIVLMLLWMLAPVIFNISYIVINIRQFLLYQGSSN